MQSCSGDAPPAYLRYRVGAGFGAFASDLRLKGNDVAIAERAMTATLDVRTSERVTLQGGLGAVLSGSIAMDGVRHTVLPGWIASVAIAYRLVDDHGAVPFVLLGASLATSIARTRDEAAPFATSRLTTVDGRLSVVVGKTILDAVSPYVVARVFGGPVYWTVRDDLSGGDRRHYQLGAGLSFHFDRFDAYFEGIPLGERRVSFGVGVGF